MNCRATSGTLFTAGWRIYYPDCRRKYYFCNAGVGAYVAAITVCYQHLVQPF